jgi:enoyl-CoA hydratase/carnithine racemase
MHSDYVLATPRTLLRTPFTALGLVPEAASSLLAPRIMGHARAFELLVMGRDLEADAARSRGLVNGIVSSEELEPAILSAAHELARKPRDAVLASRRLLKGDPAEVLARIEAEADVFAERLQSREAQAAFAAFLRRT